MRAVRLRTEYLFEPVGIDIRRPHFFWNCDGQGETGSRQTAYRIVARKDGNILWDSGKVISDAMTHIPYEGPDLKSRDCILWTVQLWDGLDAAGEISESFFEMGLLEPSDWKARWITGDYEPQTDTRYPVDCFRKDFTVPKNLVTARLYITACGLYEARLNGTKAGDACFTPGCTDYRKRIQYQTYDITESLLPGEENCLELELADGWYRGSINAFGQTEVYGRQTKLLCQLEMVCADGARQVVVSDERFAWSGDGPLRFADFKDGEICDLRMKPSYGGHARLAEAPVCPTASDNVPVREMEMLEAKLLTTPSGNKILDFGQNIAGFMDIHMKGAPGQTVYLQMGEILDENGELTLANIQTKKPAKNFNLENQFKTMTGQYDQITEALVATPLQEIRLTLTGGDDHYRTKYALFGFQYARVVTDGDIQPGDFKAVAVYSDMEPAGSFTCSNEKVNRFWLNTLWSMRGNYLDIPTDCPTRERLGWTGDAQIFFNSAAYFYDTAAFFRKWLKDMMDSQYEDGSIPAVVPYAGMEMLYRGTGASVGWLDAGILIPYRFWQWYDDRRILEQCYPMMRGCARFMIDNAGPSDDDPQTENPYRKYMYVKGIQLGEWLEPAVFNEPVTAQSMPQHPEECTAYMHYAMSVMAETAGLLGKTEDAALYREYAQGAKNAYLWMFLKDGAPDTDRQAKLVRPLALGLADGLGDDIKAQLQRRLAKAVENFDDHVGTGFLSTAFLLPELTKMGRADLAYRMLENEDMPGWLAQVNAGATTVWENWNGEASRNHYSPGSVCQWLFETVGGIRVDGHNHFHIEPVPGGSLTFAKVSHKSMYGTVRVCWDKDGQLTVTVPANTTADVLWNGEVKTVGSGDWMFN